ncbi:MAG: hypothetical protein OEL69_02220 [Nitrosopumilus sp.]|nr:hypothetical protein [Nitrosopumilus sp.]
MTKVLPAFVLSLTHLSGPSGMLFSLTSSLIFSLDRALTTAILVV